ncbi:uncharacterized protein [Rutidosis leptorrhynchoides]|uniref:uncharacterized protein n=1 Tax=Rutidosis leptorrhynchoides TaxID=125765 RepID=UPI003A991C72
MGDAVEFTPLSLLNNQATNETRVRVKVFITWKKTYFNNPVSAMSYEIIFIDYEGHKVRATVTKNLIPFFINTIKEGDLFDLYNFGVVACDDKVMIVNHPWKIMLYRNTNMVRCQPFELISDEFNTVTFRDLIEWKINTSQVFNVVGRLVEMNPLHFKREKGVDTKSIEFVLSDNSGFRLKCALWSHHATKLFDFVSEYIHLDVPIYVLLHNCKVHDWQGFAQVSNQLWGCRVYINEDVAPIRTFKAESDVNAEITTNGQTQAPDLKIKTVLQTAVDIFSKHQPKSMEDLLQLNEATSYVIRGRVQKINVDEGWFTYTCTKCNKKVAPRLFVDSNQALYDSILDVEEKCFVVEGEGSSVFRSTKAPAEFNEMLLNPYVWHIKVFDFNVCFNYPGLTIENVTDDKEVFQVIDDKLCRDVNQVTTVPNTQTVAGAAPSDTRFTTPRPLTATANVTPSLDDQLKRWSKRSVVTCTQLQNIFEIGKYVVKAKVAVIDEDQVWITFSCNKCHKYAGPRISSVASKVEYECDNCGPVTDVNPRIRLVVHIEDSTGVVPCGIFQHELSQLLNRSSEWLVQMNLKCGVEKKFPPVLYEIVNKSCVWMIRVTDWTSSHTFTSMIAYNVTDSPGVIDYVDRTLKLNAPTVEPSGGDDKEVTPMKVFFHYLNYTTLAYL